MIRCACRATFRDTTTKHTHNCVDYADHSAGAHLCGECGLLWGTHFLRCCLCGDRERRGKEVTLEPTTLPGGWRCTDRDACTERVRGIVAAHVGLGEVCE